MHPTIIEISKSGLLNNLQLLRQHIGSKVKLLLPIKANAYGHGLLLVANLAQAYVDYFGVACLDEAITLRSQGINKPILVFGAIDSDQIAGLVDYNIEITLSSLFKAKLLNQYCVNNGKKCKVQLKVDTGMNRVGVRPESFLQLLEFVLGHSALELTGVYSHFAMSESLNNQVTNAQLSQFQTIYGLVKKYKPEALCHIANSGGVCYYADSYFDMVRPGLLSYGYIPGTDPVATRLAEISPCFSLKSKVSYFKVVKPGVGISYNHRYTTATTSRIITIPIGYGDGYRRGLSATTDVLLRGKRYPIAGTICMDMFMVDIGVDGEAYVGDEVVLIGKQGDMQINILELANNLNTIIYEVLVGFNQRIPRIIV